MKTLLSHGSSDHRHREQLKALANKVSALLDEKVAIAFLNDGDLPARSTVLPLFLGAGKHVCEDIPRLAAISDCTLLPPLDNHADAIAKIAIDQAIKNTRRINALFVLYRFAGFEHLAAALYAKMKPCSKHALASLHAEPAISSVLQHWHGEGVESICLQPMLLFEGKSMDRLRAMTQPFDVSIAPVLSGHDGFAELVADCFRKHA